MFVELMKKSTYNIWGGGMGGPLEIWYFKL